jgi:shikimate kinase
MAARGAREGYLLRVHPEQNLVLTGFMGTGKTTIGRELAVKLGMEFVDTDELIESRHGPIERIFAERGEAEFRAIERDVARELGSKTGQVIATGGKMILDPESFRWLSRHGRIFSLVASPEVIHQRIIEGKAHQDRPLLRVDDPRRRIIELLAERDHEYARFQQVDTDDANPAEIADEIVRLWRSPGGG